MSESLWPIDPGSSVHGIFQARILEHIVISYYRESSWPRDQTQVSYISCTGRWILYPCATWETPASQLLRSKLQEFFSRNYSLLHPRFDCKSYRFFPGLLQWPTFTLASFHSNVNPAGRVILFLHESQLWHPFVQRSPNAPWCSGQKSRLSSGLRGPIYSDSLLPLCVSMLLAPVTTVLFLFF